MADIKDAPNAEPGAALAPQTTGVSMEISQLTADFREMLECATREIERWWAGKAAQFLMETQKLQGGEILFPDKKSFTPIGWPLENGGSSHTLKTLEEWLLPGEFVIIASGGRSEHSSRSCFTAYTNFARLVQWVNGHMPCLGIYYEGKEYPRNQNGAYLTPGQPNRRWLKPDEDKPFPLTLQQCRVMCLAAKEDYRSSRQYRGDEHHEYCGGSPPVDALILLFKECAEQPALYQLAVEKKALEVERALLAKERAELEADRAARAEKVGVLAAKTQFIDLIVAGLNKEKQDALRSKAAAEERGRIVMGWLQAAQGFDSLQVVQLAITKCIAELEKVGAKTT